MVDQIKVIRGMRDILPADMDAWYQLEDGWRQLAESYGYQQVRTPIMEKTALFKRSIGDVTDIVEKEMYSFDDKGGDNLSLRPEGTASIVRAGIQNGLLVNQIQRLWYSGPMFRRERPQKGRYRQFFQLGAEAFGMPGADIEIELIFMASRFWKLLGLENIELQLNTLGTAETRLKYKELLVSYLRDHLNELDEDSLRRLNTNPLRILDSKNTDMQNLIEAAPKLKDNLDQQSSEHFAELLEILDFNGQAYTINPRLVRGLDYYSHTVFEFVTNSLGAQGTVCAGGRYDSLVEQLGGKATYAAGFAMGIDRLVLMLQDQQKVITQKSTDIYFVMAGANTAKHGQKLAEMLRNELPGIHLVAHSGGGSFKSQMKKADKSGASLAIILGESEVEKSTVNIKFLRQDQQQLEIDQTQLVSQIKQLLNN
ncbi:MAG: histidine--tRNA ligase [Gammaproteobacteria bacterium]|jgi:histidyl-tRNA synthetase|nr:histidine--tRNA ligase [Gammaproteobacteria bacterium]MBT4450437.1 histidine--tRNA ligase [Gammaproteobacteria bacterium]MBT6457779.1 histidine--tRNA ligase [Gammaproteobacteria bacterium]